MASWKYSDALADRICDELANGKSMIQICKQEGMPNRTTVLRWMQSNEDFAAKCARAREAQADYLFDGMQAIEDSCLSGDIDPKAASVVLSSQQWRASKLRPKVYGARVDMDITARQAEVSPDPIDHAGWVTQYAADRVAPAKGSAEGAD